jgi:DNA invertase Pin-like site-specific DNA recombinase
MINLLLPLLSARDEHERNELLRRMWTMAKRLPPRQRDTFALLFKDEDGKDLFTLMIDGGILSWKEVAEGMGRSIAVVSRLRERMPMDPEMVARELKTSQTKVYKWWFRASATLYDACR